ncbi:hypothetical protein [Streptomyces sp. YIM B13518]
MTAPVPRTERPGEMWYSATAGMTRDVLFALFGTAMAVAAFPR